MAAGKLRGGHEIVVVGERRRAERLDNGPGAPEEALPLLFKPFYRVDDSRGTTTGGMGLGLAIVRNAVAIHGGAVTARNVSPHGLEVEIQLPIAPVPAGRRSSAEVKLAQV